MELEKIQELIFKEYQKNGYHKEWTNNFENNYSSIRRKFDIAELGLITTEVTEAIEEIRKDKDVLINDKLFIECADIIIRTLNFMTRNGANAEYYILSKHEKNMKREKLHGKEV